MVLPRTPVQNPFVKSLQSSDASSINPIRPKPLNRSYSQNAPFDTMKIRHRFCPHGVRRELYFSIRHSHQSKIIRSWSGFGGCGHSSSGIGTPKRLRWKKLKQWAERNAKGSPPTPTTGPCHILFWVKRGAPSLISFSNYFLRGEFCHIRTRRRYLCWPNLFGFLIYY
jgi:hypothetical protein